MMVLRAGIDFRFIDSVFNHIVLPLRQSTPPVACLSALEPTESTSYVVDLAFVLDVKEAVIVIQESYYTKDQRAAAATTQGNKQVSFALAVHFT